MVEGKPRFGFLNGVMNASCYRGRLAPSPTGFLHLGHARTFWTAFQRAQMAHGTLVLRNEDLDPIRSKPLFVNAMMEDLHWLGISWDEGPDCGGPFNPYSQSQRGDFYHCAFEKLRDGHFIYPCTCSRQDVLKALHAPHAADDEPIYPGTCRNNTLESTVNRKVNWRFRIPDGEAICFVDAHFGPQKFVAGRDFGDFVVWRADNVPSYQLAVVVDDALMKITEVVRGADLLLSTARQILLYKALGWNPPAFFHCPLMTDATGLRLAKRNDALSLRTLRENGTMPGDLQRLFSTGFLSRFLL